MTIQRSNNMNTLRPDHLQQRLHDDAEHIQVTASDDLSLRITNQLQARRTITRDNPRLRSYWAWGLAAPAALTIVLLLGREAPQKPLDISLVQVQPIVSHLGINLNEAIASRENTLRSELDKVENDLQKLSSLIGLGDTTLSK